MRSGGWSSKIGWDREASNIVIGVPWRLVDGKWTVDRPTIQIDQLPPPRQESKPSEPLQNAQVAMRSDLESEHKPTLTPAASGLRNVSK